MVLNSSPDRWIELPLPDEPKVSLPGLALRVGDQLLHGLERLRRVGDQQVGHHGHARQRREVLDRVERHLLVERRR